MNRYYTVTIKSTKSNHETLSLPAEHMNKMGVTKGETLTLASGCSDVTVTISEANNEQCMKVSNNLLTKLGLYSGQSVNIYQQSKDKLKVGPYIGVFINIGSIKSISLGTPHQRLVELAKASIAESAILYFFSIRDINWPQMRISGFSYNTNDNTWQKIDYPFPDVVFDRGGGFLPKQLPVAKYIRKQFLNVDKLQKLNTQHYFNKWKVHQQLNNYKEMQKSLPETVYYTTPDNLAKMLDKYNCVYLKSCEGSNGRQVIRITNTDFSKYNISYFNKKVIFETISNIEEIIEKSCSLFDSKSFIIQQGINVLEYQENNLDMRALMQKNKTGQWQITAIPVRVASNHCGITSTSTGSTCYQFDYAFLKLLGYSTSRLNKIKSKITDLLYSTVKIIELEYGKFGELGIDFAIDKKDNLWFIEVNAKPGKDTILLSGNEDASKKGFLVPIQYAKFLTGFYDD